MRERAVPVERMEAEENKNSRIQTSRDLDEPVTISLSARDVSRI